VKKSIFALCLFLFASLTFSQESQKTIFGTVSDDFGTLKDVNITIKGNDTDVATDSDGKYEIKAKEGDVLLFSRMGLLPAEIVVEDVTRVLNVTMFEKVEELDEVTVSEKRLRKQQRLAIEYNSNTNLIKSAFQILDKDTAGYSLRILDEKDINVGAQNINTVLNGRFAGVFARCNEATNELIVTLRPINGMGGSGGGVLFDVDGQLFEKLPCSFIDPANIKRIAVIPSYSGTSSYGGAARGGVVIINSKTANFQPRDENGEVIDLARVQDNKYFDDATAIDNVSDSPLYVQKLSEANTEEESRKTYESIAPKYSTSYFFFLDAYSYFISKWKNNEFADKILQDNWKVFDNNPVALKSLAYIHHANGDFQKANDLYKEIFILRPNYVQSYRDLANSYVETRNYKKAAAIFARYRYLLEEDFLTDTKMDFSILMDRELNNLIKFKGRDLLSKRDLKKLTLDDEFDGTRLVFEWADSEAEFELQFVNPKNRYFSWKHSLRDNAERIQDEKAIGYSTEEYLIDGTLKGNWKVNIKYLGNKSLTPTYLKATVYHNYGDASQRKKTKVFKLSLKNVNQQLFEISNLESVVSK